MPSRQSFDSQTGTAVRSGRRRHSNQPRAPDFARRLAARSSRDDDCTAHRWRPRFFLAVASVAVRESAAT